MSSQVYAVIRTGGKQYRVTPGQRLVVERLDGERGDQIAFNEVLLVRGEDGAVSVGAPTLDDASVTAEIADQKRGRKIPVFKYKAKTRYRRLRGHRQHETHLRIAEIALGGQTWAYEPPAPAEPEPVVEPDNEPESEPEAAQEAQSEIGPAVAEATEPEDAPTADTAEPTERSSDEEER